MRRMMKQTSLSFALVVSCASMSQTALSQASNAPVDPRNAPAGYIAPKTDGQRDMSMEKYARDSFFDGEEGVVDLRIVVRRDGSVGQSEVQMSSGSARLDKYATDLVKDWHFQPATVNGSPVDAWHTVSIIWALQTLRFSLSSDVLSSMVVSYINSPAGQSRTAGLVTARILVARNGNVRKVFIESPSGRASIDELTRKFLTGMRFSFPSGTSGDAAWLRIPIEWNVFGDRLVEKDGCMQAGASTWDATIAACNNVLKEKSLTPYQRALAFAERARAHLWKQEIDDAISDFDAGIRTSPGISDLFIGRAQARFAKGEPELAASDLDSAVMVEPLSHLPYVARAEASLARGDPARAMADYRNALTNIPSYDLSAAYADICNSLSANGRPQEALAGCDKAISLEPNSARFLTIRGHVHFKLRQYDLAISDYNAALQTGVSNAMSLYGRGVAKLKTGNAAGQADLDSARTLNPHVAEEMAQIGIQP